MRKALKRIAVCFLAASFVWVGSVFADRQKLREELVRLHVVAASDSEEDQQLKLRVRDAVVESLGVELGNLKDARQAKAYLQENLTKIREIAQAVLKEAGCGDGVSVKLCTEEFTTRVYDTFTLPAGIYDALRITIGPGEGQNWWCVVFPALCLSATSEDFTDAACGAGFSETLADTLTGEEGYELRFFLLDALGSLENFLRRE